MLYVHLNKLRSVKAISEDDDDNNNNNNNNNYNDNNNNNNNNNYNEILDFLTFSNLTTVRSQLDNGHLKCPAFITD